MKKIVSIFLIGIFIFACNPSNKFDEKKYLNEGKEIAQTTGKTLSGQVKKAIQEKGPFEAINFCKLSAYPLTDSLSDLYHVQINRVALKYRNQENKALLKDREIIKKYELQLSNGLKLKPKLIKQENKIVFYAPIILQKACLLCHGNPQLDIPDTLYKHILTLYPDDLAVNFKEGDLRAVWKLEFDKE